MPCFFLSKTSFWPFAPFCSTPSPLIANVNWPFPAGVALISISQVFLAMMPPSLDALRIASVADRREPRGERGRLGFPAEALQQPQPFTQFGGPLGRAGRQDREARLPRGPRAGAIAHGPAAVTDQSPSLRHGEAIGDLVAAARRLCDLERAISHGQPARGIACLQRDLGTNRKTIPEQ